MSDAGIGPQQAERSGPLAGVRVVEFAGLGPAPFCAMLLADLGASVLRIERKPAGGRRRAELFDDDKNILHRGRRSIVLDLKHAQGRAAALKLVSTADVLIEGFRPGVMERLGLGPTDCEQVNARLVYGRMTGYGQSGPWAARVGHDINYLALSGALHSIGRSDGGPVPPLNLVADFGGGAMLLAVGVLAALWEARSSGRGQVVDAAMTDGSALLMAMTYTLKAMGDWSGSRQSNLLDGGAPFYDTYACADGRHVAVGAIEPQFYRALLEGLGLHDDARLQGQSDRTRWPEQKAVLAAAFAARTRDEWMVVFDRSDACVTPVLDLDEAPRHAHNRARATFVEHAGLLQPAPAPRFSRTPATIGDPPTAPGSQTVDALRDWVFSDDEIAALTASGALVVD
jgi:alpha-methylacyl-CoA racemase